MRTCFTVLHHASDEWLWQYVVYEKWRENEVKVKERESEREGQFPKSRSCLSWGAMTKNNQPLCQSISPLLETNNNPLLELVAYYHRKLVNEQRLSTSICSSCPVGNHLFEDSFLFCFLCYSALSSTCLMNMVVFCSKCGCRQNSLTFWEICLFAFLMNVRQEACYHSWISPWGMKLLSCDVSLAWHIKASLLKKLTSTPKAHKLTHFYIIFCSFNMYKNGGKNNKLWWK